MDRRGPPVKWDGAPDAAIDAPVCTTGQMLDSHRGLCILGRSRGV